MLRRHLLLFLIFLFSATYQSVTAQTPIATPSPSPLPSSEKTEDLPQKNVDQPLPASPDLRPSSTTVPAVPSQTDDNSVKSLPSQTAATSVNINRIGLDPNQMISLSLNDAIRRALENNNQIEVARNDVRLSETILRSLQGVYDPQFNFSPTFTRNSQIGQAATNNLSNNNNFTGLVRPGGGSYQTFFNVDRREAIFGSGAQAVLNQGGGGGAIYSTNLGFGYTQPLFRNFRIDDTRRQIRIQRKRLEQSDADFRRQTIEIIAQVQNAYWDLVFALRDQQNRVANLNLTRENSRRVEAQINAGAVAPLALAEVRTEYANREGDLLLATQQVERAENILKQLILPTTQNAEWRSQLVPTEDPPLDNAPLSLADALKDAVENRPELRRLRLQKDINAVDIDFFKEQTKPRIDITPSVYLVGFSRTGVPNFPPNTFAPLVAGDPNFNSSAFLLQELNRVRSAINLSPVQSPLIPVSGVDPAQVGGYRRSFTNLFRTDALNFQIGVTIQFPLRNRVAKANLAGARVQQNQLTAQTQQQEQIILAEVRNALQSVEIARQRITTARTARENAEIQLRGEQKLYELGRSNTFLLFQRENSLANARNAEIRAQTDYNKSLAELQRSTSTTLRANSITVETIVGQ